MTRQEREEYRFIRVQVMDTCLSLTQQRREPLQESQQHAGAVDGRRTKEKRRKTK